MCKYCETTTSVCRANYEGYESRVYLDLKNKEIGCELVKLEEGKLRGVASKQPLKINYCPVCGRDLNPAQNSKYLTWEEIGKLAPGTKLKAKSRLTVQPVEFIYKERRLVYRNNNGEEVLEQLVVGYDSQGDLSKPYKFLFNMYSFSKE